MKHFPMLLIKLRDYDYMFRATININHKHHMSMRATHPNRPVASVGI